MTTFSNARLKIFEQNNEPEITTEIIMDDVEIETTFNPNLKYLSIKIGAFITCVAVICMMILII